VQKPEVLEKYREAGRILAEVRGEAIKKVKVGVKLLDVAESVERSIQQKGGAVAFPTNISLNEEAAHATPITVPGGDRRLTYDPLKRIGVGLSRLGTSQAISIGAYAYAQHELERQR